jgi:predicted dehydrogenase
MADPARRVKVAVVGTGIQGAKHVGKLAGRGDCDLVGVYDVSPEVAEKTAAEHSTRRFATLEEVAGAAEAAVVAVPTRFHPEVGCRLLEAGVHVLIEKPLAPTRRQARELLDAASAAGRVLAVGHSEYFNPATRALLELELEPGFVEVHRLASFKPRSLDVDVVLDLMIHDIQVLHSMDSSEVVEIRASGLKVLTERIDIANVRIELASGCVANLTASRVSLEPIRKLRVFSRGGAYYALDYANRKVSGVVLERGPEGQRVAQMELEVPEGDALEMELAAFMAACAGEPTRTVDGAAGYRALETALAIIERLG